MRNGSLWSNVVSEKEVTFYEFDFETSDLNLRSQNQASESTQLRVTRVFFLSLLSCNFYDRLSSNFHRFVILYLCWDTPTVKTSLWQLPIVSSAFKFIEDKLIICDAYLVPRTFYFCSNPPPPLLQISPSMNPLNWWIPCSSSALVWSWRSPWLHRWCSGGSCTKSGVRAGAVTQSRGRGWWRGHSLPQWHQWPVGGVNEQDVWNIIVIGKVYLWFVEPCKRT